MVQMKQEEIVKILQHTPGLYIPHGSDETGFGGGCGIEVYSLYIPHGSDETKVLG